RLTRASTRVNPPREPSGASRCDVTSSVLTVHPRDGWMIGCLLVILDPTGHGPRAFGIPATESGTEPVRPKIEGRISECDSPQGKGAVPNECRSSTNAVTMCTPSFRIPSARSLHDRDRISYLDKTSPGFGTWWPERQCLEAPKLPAVSDPVNHDRSTIILRTVRPMVRCAGLIASRVGHPLPIPPVRPHFEQPSPRHSSLNPCV